jgi:hypothetical protein
LSVASFDCFVSLVEVLDFGRLGSTPAGGSPAEFCELSFLLDHSDRPFGAPFGLEDGFVGLGPVGVQTGGDADLEVSQAQIGRPRLGHGLANLACDVLFESEQVVGRVFDRVRPAREQLPIDVEHGHFVDRHIGDGGRHQMPDRLAGGAIVGAVRAEGGRRKEAAARVEKSLRRP